MKLAVFYRDAFQPGGVPGEMAQMVNTLSNSHPVAYWGKAGISRNLFEADAACVQYRNLPDLASCLPSWLSRHQPEQILLIGFFVPEHLIVVYLAKRHGIPVILNPLAQLTDAVMQGKIFTQDPDIRQLEQSQSAAVMLPLRQFIAKLIQKSNPWFKTVWLNTMGKWLLSQCHQLAVFSTYEASQCQQYTALPLNSFLLLWGTFPILAEEDKRHYYRDVLGFGDEKANFVYWGRLDWHYKGLDRLLNGVLHVVRQHTNSEIPFRLFMIGPDYRGGVTHVQQWIEAHQLQHVVYLMLPGQYPAGSKTPLRDASASICLSRWDGFPRTLRESVSMGVPVMVSEETHFSALVRQFSCGMAPEQPDNAAVVAEQLLALTQPRDLKRMSHNASRLAAALSWQAVLEPLLQQLETTRVTSPQQNPGQNMPDNSNATCEAL
jgi:glycosyltransferase involved in cell wall biosynthesis